MPAILGLLPAALNAARGGMSANAFYRHLQSIGQGARRSDVLALFAEARGIVSHSGAEAFKDIAGKPDVNELPAWPTKDATGVKQTVTLLYRDKTTGKVLQTYWSTVNAEPLTRQEAVSRAVSAYAANNSIYATDVLGALHTSAYRLVPFG